MTYKQWALSYCQERGLSLEESEVVVNSFMTCSATAAMAGRWNQIIEQNIPPARLQILAHSLKRLAIEFIQANSPDSERQLKFR